jgi:glycosyltransferase involved in cell wall biosynthesis
MDEVLISVVVPVYNVEHYLKKCVDSICHQTYRNLEIILVDDGSTDCSGSLCDEFATSDSRIRVIHKSNGGLSDARNAGMELASGEWWMFVDSDDYIAPDTAETLLLAAVENHCEIAVCNMMRIYEDGKQEPFYCPVTEPTIWAGEQRFETLRQPSVCNKLFRADLFKELRFPKRKFYEDTFVYHVLAHRASRIALTGLSGYYYLSRRESILGQSQFTDRYFDYVEAIHERAMFLFNHGVSRYGEEACLSLYAAIVNSTKNIRKTPQNAEHFQRMWEWYELAYRNLMSSPDTSIKQKLRLFFLKYAPKIHNKLY